MNSDPGLLKRVGSRSLIILLSWIIVVAHLNMSSLESHNAASVFKISISKCPSYRLVYYEINLMLCYPRPFTKLCMEEMSQNSRKLMEKELGNNLITVIIASIFEYLLCLFGLCRVLDMQCLV